MFTRWQQVENWIRDNGLNSWRFSYDRTGTNTDASGEEKQTRSNRLAVLSDAFPGELDEKIALTKRRLMDETNQTLYGYGKRGKENTGWMYCEVRLVDELQLPSNQSVSSPVASPIFDESAIVERVRKEVMLEYENKRYQEEKAAFEKEKREFEDDKKSAIGQVVRFMSPVLAALGQKNIAGLDSDTPVYAAPIRTVCDDPEVEAEHVVDEVFTDKESNKLFELMARFKAVEPRYLELIESVVSMAERKDPTYDMAKGFLLK